MAFILFYGSDDRIPRMLKEYFEEQHQAGGELNTAMQVKDDKGLNEALIAMVIDVMIFEQKSLMENHFEFPSSLRKKKNFKGKLLLSGDETDPVKIMKYLESGWADYLVSPPDRPMLIEKVELYATGSRTSNRQVYSLSLSQPADIARTSTMEELSEFGCKIRSSQAYPLDDLVMIYSKALSSGGEQTQSALARCFKSEAHPSSEGFHLNHFSFVGVRPDTLQNIRNYLRKSYTTNKGRP